MLRIYSLIYLSMAITVLTAQVITPTSADKRISSVADFDQLQPDGDITNLAFENIGPTVFSGRITDLAVDPTDPTHFYVAYGSGGLWETTNNGTTFTPIFDHEAVITIGAIAVNWDANIIWVGTGEVNSSRSSYAGVGMYISRDGGDSWEHKGLEESHHIGRIVLHPTDPEVAHVAVLGHLYSSNPERGVYKTTDGGATWTHTLAVNDKTGAVDMIADPTDPDILYAAMWQRERSAWDFVESGTGSGIYKSTDSGDTWTPAMNGFPAGDGVGRIGLSITSDDNGTRIYALLDNYDRRPKEDDEDDGLTKDELRGISMSAFAAIDTAKLETFLRDNGFPEKHSVKSVFADVASGKLKATDLVSYLETANSLLFDTPVIGAELYMSDDNGGTWTKTHDDYLDGVYFSYGYYFGVVTADPTDKDVVYIAGVPILRSDDAGKTWQSINGDNVHSDHHKIWINPSSPHHIVNGNDGGINISYDSGESWIKCNSPAVGQFYYINADNQKPYMVYGGTQDNGVWRGSHNYRAGVRWHNTGKYPYESIMGGDGMQVQIDSRDNTVYTGFQFGNYFRVNPERGERKYITPQHELGERPYRWNWQAPIHLSIHNEDIVYFGANKLFRSMDRGEHFSAISDDLTTGGRKGDVPFGTLATVHESPLRFGLIYTGSDDGLAYVTRDGGYTWDNITGSLPQGRWISRIQASAHKEGRVYISLNGYRSDDFAPYIYVSEDYGKTWTSIAADLPQEPINVVKEDPHHEDLLYIGTDRGVYVSMDRGTGYTRLDKTLPNVPVHDIVIQARDKDLLIGTHGRSIYLADLEPIYALANADRGELMVMEIEDTRYNSSVGSRRSIYDDYRKTEVDFVAYSPTAQEVTITVMMDDLTVQHWTAQLDAGINYLEYDTAVANDAQAAYITAMKDEKLKPADDGQLYLHKGEYTLAIGDIKTNFKLK